MSSASQWKRCFTNADSWMKWNIFSALFLGLELPGSLPPHIQGHPTAHLSVTHPWRTRKTRIFLQKCAGFLGQQESDSSHPPARARGFSKDTSTRILSSCSLSHGNSLCLWFFWRESNKSFIQAAEEATEKAKWLPQPPLLWHIQVWGALSHGKENSTPNFFPMQKFWE